MKVEAAIFGVISVLLAVFAVVYGVWAKEPIGTTALALSAGLTILVGGFFWFISRRIERPPGGPQGRRHRRRRRRAGLLQPRQLLAHHHRPLGGHDGARPRLLLPVADHHRRGGDPAGRGWPAVRVLRRAERAQLTCSTPPRRALPAAAGGALRRLRGAGGWRRQRATASSFSWPSRRPRWPPRGRDAFAGRGARAGACSPRSPSTRAGESVVPRWPGWASRMGHSGTTVSRSGTGPAGPRCASTPRSGPSPGCVGAHDPGHRPARSRGAGGAQRHPPQAGGEET